MTGYFVLKKQVDAMSKVRKRGWLLLCNVSMQSLNDYEPLFRKATQERTRDFIHAG